MTSLQTLACTIKPELLIYITIIKTLHEALPLKQLTGDLQQDKGITKENIEIFERREAIKKKILNELFP